MSMQRVLPFLVLLLVASAATMVFAAGRGERALTAAAAAGFSAVIIGAAMRINTHAWRNPPEAAADAIAVMRRNTRLAAMIYAWGAGAMLAVYSLSGLEWRHWWQYGLGLALISCGLFYLVHRLMVRPVMLPAWLNVLHGAAALGALVFLIGTGKLATAKDDWAANDVFLFGGIAILALCVIAAVTQAKMKKRRLG